MCLIFYWKLIPGARVSLAGAEVLRRELERDPARHLRVELGAPADVAVGEGEAVGGVDVERARPE